MSNHPNPTINALALGILTCILFQVTAAAGETGREPEKPAGVFNARSTDKPAPATAFLNQSSTTNLSKIKGREVLGAPVKRSGIAQVPHGSSNGVEMRRVERVLFDDAGQRHANYLDPTFCEMDHWDCGQCVDCTSGYTYGFGSPYKVKIYFNPS